MVHNVRYDENFLVRRSREILVTEWLPFKLQKRELLSKLGFPIDENSVIPLREYHPIEHSLQRHKNDTSFLAGIHLKPMTTYITPFFLIKNDEILYRDESGATKLITFETMLKIIRSFSKNGWVEFIKPIWSNVCQITIFPSITPDKASP